MERARKQQDASNLRFTPVDALKRLDRAGDLFAPVLSLKQQLPADVVASIRADSKRTGQRRPDLHQYENKRDFARTSEPAPSAPRRSKQGGKRRYVIQKHAASHLHFDFRLEIGGVLKSWAVAKGIPMEPGVRRLANATEDHPIGYLDFEGIIPKRQYGGGTVMVWDIGTYEIVEGNYWHGMLRIGMAGKKLRGEWLLTKDRSKGANAWIIERVDEPVRVSAIKEDASVLTGRSMAEITKAADAVWQSNRPSAGAHQVPAPVSAPTAAILPDINDLPKASAQFLEPMQALLVSALPESEQWAYEEVRRVSCPDRQDGSSGDPFPAKQPPDLGLFDGCRGLCPPAR